MIPAGLGMHTDSSTTQAELHHMADDWAPLIVFDTHSK